MHPERTERIALVFDDEEQAAEVLKDARRRFPGKVRAAVEDLDDRGAGGARRREEGEGVVVGPSYAMTEEQAKQGALGMVVGAAVLGILTLLVVLPITASGTISVTTAALIVLAALMAGGTVGVMMGGRSGGIREERRDEENHDRRYVIEIDATPGEAVAVRELQRAHAASPAASRAHDRPHGPIEDR